MSIYFHHFPMDFPGLFFHRPKVGELGPALQRLRAEPAPSAVAPEAVEVLREELCSVDGEAPLFGPFFHGVLGWLKPLVFDDLPIKNYKKC
jgi:hypothetical protein